MQDESENTSIKDSVKNVGKASIIVALVAGLSGIIYLAVRENPKNFSVVTPFKSQPIKKEVPQTIRRFPWTTIQKLK